MSQKPMSRRNMLKGSGVLIGLPLLESMIPSRAHAAPAQARFVVSYGGISSGSSRSANAFAEGALPRTLTPAWKGLEPVIEHVSIVSNLKIPTWAPVGTADASTAQPGFRYKANHGKAMSPILSGNRTLDKGMAVMAGGHTVDQVVADAIGMGSRRASLQTRLQADGYGKGGDAGIMSCRKVGTQLQAQAPLVQPSEIFRGLFDGFSLPPAGGGGGGGATPLSLALRKRKSSLDFVLRDANRLMASVSAEDRQKLDLHFTEIRSLEKRIFPGVGAGAGSGSPVSSSCSIPQSPLDPAIVGVGTNGGWAQESYRAELISDLIRMAFVCDITRVVSYMLTFDQCMMSTQDASKHAINDMHEEGHKATVLESMLNANWHARMFAMLVKKLADTPDTLSGGSILDQTFMILVFSEGEASHGTDTMSAAIAGRKNQVKLGQHINANKEHTARLMVAGMQSLGINVNALGEVNGSMSAILK